MSGNTEAHLAIHFGPIGACIGFLLGKQINNLITDLVGHFVVTLPEEKRNHTPFSFLVWSYPGWICGSALKVVINTSDTILTNIFGGITRTGMGILLVILTNKIAKQFRDYYVPKNDSSKLALGIQGVLNVTLVALISRSLVYHIPQQKYQELKLYTLYQYLF